MAIKESKGDKEEKKKEKNPHFLEDIWCPLVPYSSEAWLVQQGFQNTGLNLQTAKQNATTAPHEIRWRPHWEAVIDLDHILPWIIRET